jgi:multiple antibiotic resistance protein
MITAILLAWMLSCIILFLGPQLHRLLGKNGLIACERLMAMVLVMLAIQRFMEGVQEFLQKT